MKISLVSLINNLDSLFDEIYNSDKASAELLWEHVIRHKVIQNLIQVKRALNNERANIDKSDKDRTIKVNSLNKLSNSINRVTKSQDLDQQLNKTVLAVSQLKEYLSKLQQGPRATFYESIKVEDIGKHTHRIWELIHTNDKLDISDAVKIALMESMSSEEEELFYAKLPGMLFNLRNTVAKDTLKLQNKTTVATRTQERKPTIQESSNEKPNNGGPLING
jgi:hypothetical protein